MFVAIFVFIKIYFSKYRKREKKNRQRELKKGEKRVFIYPESKFSCSPAAKNIVDLMAYKLFYPPPQKKKNDRFLGGVAFFGKTP